MRKTTLRQIPKVDLILASTAWQELTGACPISLAKDMLRQYLDDLRFAIKEETISSVPDINQIVEETRRRVIAAITPGLRRVINATGVILHTNLGRSLLADKAAKAVAGVASSFSNLEYDLERGERGERYEYCNSALHRLIGGEDSLVVNNNAAAVFLILNTLAQGREVIISRGELIEIGGSFRIPDVMVKSGTVLREVGTTNKTYINDYEAAITDNTGLIMRAHTSNYRIRGFTHEATLQELFSLGEKYGIPTYFDAGSGLFYPLNIKDMSEEPLVSREIMESASVISFSGDKLLGGPQAGIIIGSKQIIDEMKKNPLTRALRPDKFTLAALESTLLLYLDRDRVKDEIPTLRMIYEGRDSLKRRSERLAGKLKGLSGAAKVFVVETCGEIGGGSLPDVELPSFGIALEPSHMSVVALQKLLRSLETPIVGKIEKNRIILDMRTISEKDEPELLLGLKTALRNEK